MDLKVLCMSLTKVSTNVLKWSSSSCNDVHVATPIRKKSWWNQIFKRFLELVRGFGYDCRCIICEAFI